MLDRYAVNRFVFSNWLTIDRNYILHTSHCLIKNIVQQQVFMPIQSHGLALIKQKNLICAG